MIHKANMKTIIEKLIGLLKKDARLVSAEGELLKNQVQELARKNDAELLKLLLSEKEVKQHFFFEIEKTLIFDKEKFVRFVTSKQFLPDSYTAFKNKIGLTVGNEYLGENKDVVLVWPYKDCVLEGGMTKEDQKRDEIFYNETLAPDDINRLLDPKVFTNFKRIDAKGEHKLDGFKRDEKGTIKDNLIIKGNNLLALASLKKEFAGKVKLIYIDPPYNTDTDSFSYNDSFNHSSWLVFMRNRIEIAQKLLSDDGVIFVQCDDNEQAYLKVLMDELFGREKFVGLLIWQRAKGGGQAKEIVKGHDYILVYKNFVDNLTLKRDKSIQKKIVEIDGYQYIKNDDFIRKVFGKYSSQNEENFDRRCFYEELEALKGLEKKKEVDEKIESGEYILEKHPSGNHVICRLEPIDEAYSTFYSIIKNISDDESPVVSGYLSEVGKNDLAKLKISGFDYPKPVGLIKLLIKSIMKFDDDGIILDFFAGSGTTAQAVLELNNENQKKYNFILCEQMDYVDTVTKRRVEKVIKDMNSGNFIFLELAKWNEQWIEKIEKAKIGKELVKVWEEMKNAAFLSYKVDPKTVAANTNDFAGLSVADQKKFLIECLDKNQLYVNLSEIEDKEYGVNKDDQKLNGMFYQSL